MQQSAPTRSVSRLGFALTFPLLAFPLSALALQQTAAQTPTYRPAPRSLPGLPATPPTAPPSAAPAQAQAPPEPKHAQVVYGNGMLSVIADNSSLNQILRQISGETGMKITGGVAEERVFGHYGPAAPSQVLATLLDGTGSNMLLVHREGSTPAELVLTPRQGGPTPPSPNARVFDERSDSEDAPEPPEAQEQLEPGPSAPASSLSPGATPAAAGQAPTDGSNPQSPNGVKTPQEIYNQLMRMRQQQTSPQ